MTLMCIKPQQKRAADDKSVSRMEKKRQGHLRISRHSTSSASSSGCGSMDSSRQTESMSSAGHANLGMVQDSPKMTSTLSISRQHDETTEISAIAQSPGCLPPGAQCSTTELATSMGPLHSTMDYPQHSTPERFAALSIIHQKTPTMPKRRQPTTKSRSRLAPVGEESMEQSKSSHSSSQSSISSKSKNKSTRSRNSTLLSLGSCFSAKSADADKKCRKSAAKPMTELPKPTQCYMNESNASSSLAVHAGSWLEDVSTSQVKKLPGYYAKTATQRRTIHSVVHPTKQYSSSSVKPQALTSMSFMRSGHAHSMESSQGHYVTMRHENGPCHSMYHSKTSQDTCYDMSVSSRPPCIGKEASPAVPASFSRSSGYQSTQDSLSFRSDDSDLCSEPVTPRYARSVLEAMSGVDISELPTLAVF